MYVCMHAGVHMLHSSAMVSHICIHGAVRLSKDFNIFLFQDNTLTVANTNYSGANTGHSGAIIVARILATVAQLC